MALAQSKLTAQGQISVPAEIRRRLGVGPGSVLEWDEEEDGKVVVRKAGRYSSEDIRRVIFANRLKPAGVTDVKAAIKQHIRDKHARR